MPHIDLPVGVPGIRSAFNFRPLTAGPLLELAEALLRADNTLSRGERELIAAYVSHLNECYYCETSHSAFAGLQLEGGTPLVDQVKRDPEQAAISEKLRALLAVAAKVQSGGRSVTEADIAAARRRRDRHRDPRCGIDRGGLLHVQPLRRRFRDLGAHRSAGLRRDGEPDRRARPPSHPLRWLRARLLSAERAQPAEGLALPGSGWLQGAGTVAESRSPSSAGSSWRIFCT